MRAAITSPSFVRWLSVAALHHTIRVAQGSPVLAQSFFCEASA